MQLLQICLLQLRQVEIVCHLYNELKVFAVNALDASRYINKNIYGITKLATVIEQVEIFYAKNVAPNKNRLRLTQHLPTIAGKDGALKLYDNTLRKEFSHMLPSPH